MKKVYFLSCFLLISSMAFAATIKTSKSGGWKQADIWDLARIPSGGDEIHILTGHTATISDKTVVSGEAVAVHIYGTLYFSQAGQLELPAGSVIYVYDGGDVVVEDTKNNNSTKLIIGSNKNTLSGSDLDAVSGPSYIDENNISNGGEPLPITLLYFTATAQGQSVDIHWAASKAWDFSHYELQRSRNGKDFEYVAVIDAEKNTDFTTEFTYSDRQPISGTSYYRLKAVDIDGSFEYKGMEVVQFVGQNFQVYPNPATTGVLKVKALQSGEDVQLTLRDHAGRQVRSLQMNRQQEEISTEGLSEGLYILLIESRQQKMQSQVYIR